MEQREEKEAKRMKLDQHTTVVFLIAEEFFGNGYLKTEELDPHEEKLLELMTKNVESSQEDKEVLLTSLFEYMIDKQGQAEMADWLKDNLADLTNASGGYFTKEVIEKAAVDGFQGWNKKKLSQLRPLLCKGDARVFMSFVYQ